MPADRGAVSHHHQLLAGAGQRHVHAADVRQEPQVARFVAARQRDDHRFLLAPLEAVHGVHLEVLVCREPVPQELHLRIVRRDHGQVPRRHAREQAFRLGGDQLGLSGIRLALRALRRRLVEAAARGVDHLQRRIVQRVPRDRWMRAQHAAVERIGRIPHDALVHPVLLGERDDRVRPRPRHALEQRHGQPAALCVLAEHRGRKLQVIAGQHRAIGLEQGEIRGRLDGLRRLVHHGQIEAPRAQRVGFEAGQGGQHDLRALQHVGLGAVLALARLGEQSARLALLRARLREPARPAPGTLLARRVAELERVLDQPRRQLRLLVLAHAGLERVLEHGGKHARGMADADRVQPCCRKPFDQVVDGEVRGRARQDRFAPRRRSPDDLYQHRRLAGAGRPVHQREVLRTVGQIQRLRLFRIESGRQRRASRGGKEAERLASQGSVPPRRLGHPPQRGREPLVRDRARQQLQRDAALAHPVGWRFVEGDRDAAARAARHDSGGGVLRDFAPLDDAHRRADADLGTPRARPGRRREGDECAAGEPLLVGRLQIHRGHSPRGALGERQLRGCLREPVPLGFALGAEERTQAVQVRRKIHGAGSTAHSLAAVL